MPSTFPAAVPSAGGLCGAGASSGDAIMGAVSETAGSEAMTSFVGNRLSVTSIGEQRCGPRRWQRSSAASELRS